MLCINNSNSNPTIRTLNQHVLGNELLSKTTYEYSCGGGTVHSSVLVSVCFLIAVLRYDLQFLYEKFLQSLSSPDGSGE